MALFGFASAGVAYCGGVWHQSSDPPTRPFSFSNGRMGSRSPPSGVDTQRGARVRASRGQPLRPPAPHGAAHRVTDRSHGPAPHARTPTRRDRDRRDGCEAPARTIPRQREGERLEATFGRELLRHAASGPSVQSRGRTLSPWEPSRCPLGDDEGPLRPLRRHVCCLRGRAGARARARFFAAPAGRWSGKEVDGVWARDLYHKTFDPQNRASKGGLRRGTNNTRRGAARRGDAAGHGGRRTAYFHRLQAWACSWTKAVGNEGKCFWDISFFQNCARAMAYGCN